MWSGNQFWTRVGRAGWVMAMPAAMTIVKLNSVSAIGALPRSAAPAVTRASPMATAPRAPKRPTTNAPGTAPAARTRMGRAVSRPAAL